MFNKPKIETNMPVNTETVKNFSQSVCFLNTLLNTIKNANKWKKVNNPIPLSKFPQNEFSKLAPVNEVKINIPINMDTPIVKILNFGLYFELKTLRRT